jgi:hypothetical protein
VILSAFVPTLVEEEEALGAEDVAIIHRRR